MPSVWEVQAKRISDRVTDVEDQLQSLALMLTYAGNPNGILRARESALCWDTTNQAIYANTSSVEGTNWSLVSSGGGGGGAPANASYITVNAEGGLSAERRIVVAGGASGVDGGADTTYTITVHDAVTLAAGATQLLHSVTGQQLSLNIQLANTVFAGPQVGPGASTPSFRALVADDIPTNLNSVNVIGDLYVSGDLDVDGSVYFDADLEVNTDLQVNGNGCVAGTFGSQGFHGAGTCSPTSWLDVVPVGALTSQLVNVVGNYSGASRPFYTYITLDGGITTGYGHSFNVEYDPTTTLIQPISHGFESIFGGTYGIGLSVSNIKSTLTLQATFGSSINQAYLYDGRLSVSGLAAGVVTQVFGLYLPDDMTSDTFGQSYGVYQAGVSDWNWFAGHTGFGAEGTDLTDRIVDIDGILTDPNSVGLLSSPSLGVNGDIYGIIARGDLEPAVVADQGFGLLASEPVVGAGASYNSYTGFYARDFSGVASTNYGFYQQGASDFNYFAGYTGIGITVPITKLHVVGTALAGAGVNAADIVSVVNDGDANINLVASTTGRNSILFSDTTRARGYIRYDHNSDLMEFYTAGTQAVVITSAQRVGIGTGSPNHLAVISSAVTADTVLGLYNTFNQASNRNWAIGLNQNGYGDFHIITSNAQNGNPISAGTTRFMIDSGGKVGIGTVTPSNYLHVYGVGVSGITGIFIENTSSTARAQLRFINDAGREAAIQYQGSAYSIGEAMYIAASSDYPVNIGTNSGASSGGSAAVIFKAGGYNNEQMRIRPDGIGVGVLSPTALVDIYNDGTIAASSVPAFRVRSSTLSGAVVNLSGSSNGSASITANFSAYGSENQVWNTLMAHRHTSSITHAYSYIIDASINTSSNVTSVWTAYRMLVYLQNTYSPTIGTFRGIQIQMTDQSGAGTPSIGTGQMIFISGFPSGVFTGNTYGIYQNGGDDYNYFHGYVGIDQLTPRAPLDVIQTGTAAVKPVIMLEQKDVTEEFIRFKGTAVNGGITRSIVKTADATGTLRGWAKVYVEDDGNQITDQAYYIPLYTLA